MILTRRHPVIAAVVATLMAVSSAAPTWAAPPVPAKGAVSVFDATVDLVRAKKWPKHRRNWHRRGIRPGEVIAGAVLLGALGIIASQAYRDRDYYGDGYYYDSAHQAALRRAHRACNRYARNWFRDRTGYRVQNNSVRDITYIRGTEYRVRGSVRIVRPGRDRIRSYRCTTRFGHVVRFTPGR